MARWVVYRNSLAVECKQFFYFPQAKDILSLVSGEIAALQLKDEKVESPKKIFPQIRYSSLGCSFSSKLTTDGEGIILDINAYRRSIDVPMIIENGRIIDHYVINDCWYFLTGNIESLERCLNEAKIKVAGHINSAQYLQIKKFEFLNKIQIFEDCVDKKSLTEVPVGLPVNQILPLRATLFPYQEQGFYWIKKTLECVHGCILGDEMGLGKTMQVIATMLFFQDKRAGRSIVVAPISLLSNWLRECHKFAPTLSVFVHHGSGRTGYYKDLSDYDVVITSYSTLANDIHMLNMLDWNLLVLDEAQNIKNPDSERRRVCCELNHHCSLAVSGTPFENHVVDVWSLLDFVMPGLLGSVDEFKEYIPDDVDGGKKLEPILSPLMIRRLVKNVAQELPPRVDIDRPLLMSEQECEMYSDLLKKARDEDSGQLNIGSLQSLRMFCTHPYLIDDSCEDVFDPIRVSAKFQHFDEIIDKIVDLHEKVIVFTSYKKMFDIFSRYLTKEKGLKNWSINGETDVENRQKIVDAFNGYSGSAVLLLNPRAAGTGLNITGANHVIHYNLEWNPSLEDQASARSYRRGQEKTVFIYRLYYRDTIEQIIQERLLRKREISEAAVVGTIGLNDDKSDIASALRIEPKR